MKTVGALDKVYDHETKGSSEYITINKEMAWLRKFTTETFFYPNYHMLQFPVVTYNRNYEKGNRE